MNNPQLISRTALAAIAVIVGILIFSQPALANVGYNQLSRVIEQNDHPAFLNLYQTYAGNSGFLQIALYEAVRNNRMNMEQFLHERGVAITPDAVAAITPNDESVELLGYLVVNCDSGIDPMVGQKLLGRAAYEQSISALQLLVNLRR